MTPSPMTTPITVQPYSYDDLRRFWVERNGRMVQRAWGELTKQEKLWQREAEARAAYCAMFDIY